MKEKSKMESNLEKAVRLYEGLSDSDKLLCDDFKQKKIDAVREQNFEEAVHWRGKEREVLGM